MPKITYTAAYHVFDSAILITKARAIYLANGLDAEDVNVEIADARTALEFLLNEGGSAAPGSWCEYGVELITSNAVEG